MQSLLVSFYNICLKVNVTLVLWQFYKDILAWAVVLGQS